MKFNLKKDIWGITFAVGTGVLTWLTYQIGKDHGIKQLGDEVVEYCDSMIERAKLDHLGQ